MSTGKRSSSKAMTLSAFETSSMATAYEDVKEGLTLVGPINRKPSPQSLKRGRWAQSFLARVESGEKLLEDVFILNLLQTASISGSGKHRIHLYALDGLFVFIHDGRLHPVGETFAHPSRLRRLRLKSHTSRRLVYYAGNIGDMIAHPRLRPSNVSFITQALPLGRKIFVDPVGHRWERLSSEDAGEICTALKNKQPILDLLFSDIAGGTAHSMDDVEAILAYVTDPFVSWPSLIDLELKPTNLLHITSSSERYTSRDTSTVTSNLPGVTITILVQRVLEATRPSAHLEAVHEGLFKQERPTDAMRLQTTEQLLRRHPALPFLWVALYVSMRHEYARAMLITGGLIDNLWDLYFLDFPDPRLEGHPPPKHSGHLDLVRICYMLLRILFPHGQSTAHERVLLSTTKKFADAAHTNRAWLRAKDLAESLKEFFSGDLRLLRRTSCARYHDGEVILREEMVTEARDREIRKGVLAGA